MITATTFEIIYNENIVEHILIEKFILLKLLTSLKNKWINK